MELNNGTIEESGTLRTRRDPQIPVSAHSRERKEKAIKTVWFLTALSAILAISFILLFLLRDSLPVFQQAGIVQFLTGTTWYPTGSPPEYGIFVLIVGTVLVTLGAMVFAVPLSIGCAIYIVSKPMLLHPAWCAQFFIC